MPYKKYILDKKQLNSNNFIKNTYCKKYFSFIVGHILNWNLTLAPQLHHKPPPQFGLSCLSMRGAIAVSHLLWSLVL